MRTVTALSVMNRIFNRRGMDPTAVTDVQKALVMDLISERLKIAWEFAYWHEWTYIEERAYRPLWYATTTYSAGDEVWDGAQGYYRSLQAANTNHAVTDPAWWVSINATMDKYVLFDQPGKTRIGATKNVYNSEQDAFREMRPLNYTINQDRLEITDPFASWTVWVKIRKESPRIVYEKYNQTTNYAEGWVVYFPSTNQTQLEGNCYRASVQENGFQYWELMEVPFDIARYITLGAAADYYRHDDQTERAERLEAQAEDEMFCSYTSAQNQNGLFLTAQVIIP